MVLIFRNYKKLCDFMQNKKDRDSLGMVKSVQHFSDHWRITLVCSESNDTKECVC